MNLLELDHAWSLEWASAEAALEGESGDLSFVYRCGEGALIGVIDGLGHGPEAAQAARAAASALEPNAGAPLAEAFARCHDATRGTRGVVMTLASFSTSQATLAWCGVGNVEAVLFRADQQAAPRSEAVTPRGGVVGYQLPPLRIVSLPISTGDVLVMVSDGIRSDFERTVTLDSTPAELAERVLRTHARGTDDALVAVVRFVGGLHG